jgi:hypothetical protein
MGHFNAPRWWSKSATLVFVECFITTMFDSCEVQQCATDKLNSALQRSLGETKTEPPPERSVPAEITVVLSSCGKTRRADRSGDRIYQALRHVRVDR